MCHLTLAGCQSSVKLENAAKHDVGFFLAFPLRMALRGQHCRTTSIAHSAGLIIVQLLTLHSSHYMADYWEDPLMK